VRLIPTGAALWFERIAGRELAWIALGWLAYASLALAGLLSGGWRLAALGLVIVATVALLVRALGRAGLPTRRETLNRLDETSAAPLGTARLRASQPASEIEGVAAALWARAQADAAKRPVRLGLPRARIGRRTRMALLTMLAAALAAAPFAAVSAPERFSRLLSPWAVPATAFEFRVRVTPPDYAAAPPTGFTLTGGETQALQVLNGSTMTVERLAGPGDWSLAGPGGRRAQARAALDEPGTWRVVQHGRTLATLPIQMAGDGVPAISFIGTPELNASGALRIDYSLQDDHGLASVAIEVDGERGGARLYPLTDAAPVGENSGYADLSSDPHAGEQAFLTLVATDGAGNAGRSPPLLVTLPQRRFTHPVAQEIVAVRADMFGGASSVRTARALADIAGDPARYDENLAVYAGLRAAETRLVYEPVEVEAPSDAEVREEVGTLLWDIALDLEDGGASRALEDLRAAMDDLMREAASGDDEALAALSDRLEQAMAAFLQQQMQAALADSPTPPPGMMQGLMSTVGADMLQAMMQDLKDRLAAGDTAGAMEALQNLRGLMESIQFAAPIPDPEAAARAEALRDAMERLEQAEIDQGELREETIAEIIRQMIRERPEDTEALGSRQGDLVQMIGEIEAALEAAGAESPEALRDAVRAMQAARQALGEGDAGAASEAQGAALQALAEAGSALERQASQAEQQAAGGMMQPGQSGSGVDPLGRPGRGFGTGDVTIPDAERLRRVQEIRALLEERARDPSRSEEERSYYLRLLKRF
jgi:hypothetical protein